jgi:pyruvate dehydrogenase E2 component (dihydrolipoamide acetyltransferase)
MHTAVEMPALSSTMKQGTVVKWYKSEGDSIKKGEVLFEVETDKVNVEVESFVSGFLRKIIIDEGIEVPIRTVIAIIADTMDEDIPADFEAARSVHVPTSEERTPEKATEMPDHKMTKIKISPLARRIAEEKGIDFRVVRGSGPGGRITRKDVESAAEDLSGVPSVWIEAEDELGIPSGTDEYEDIPLTKMRKVVAKRLQQSKMNAPHFYVDMTADATEISKLKTILGTRSEKLRAKISYNDIIIKVVAKALKEFPVMNASFLEDRIRLHKPVNIGVAVAIEEGLVVPVLKNVDQKSISQISREAAELANKARSKKLLPHEYEGGTFTITNLGMFGVEGFHAIINPPESGILAVSAVVPKPVVEGEEIIIRPCLKLSLAVDHRVIDGAVAAQFLARVKELVEVPNLLTV